MSQWIGFISGVALTAAVLVAYDRLANVETSDPITTPEQTSNAQTDVGAPDVIPPANNADQFVVVQDPKERNDGEALASVQRVATSTQPERPQRQWFPVWKPFRSELSADGFASHLTRLTDYEFRVHRESAWHYQVELAYDAENTLDKALENIGEQVGMTLSRAAP